MRRERLQRDQPFTPFSPPLIQKGSLARAESLQPCGRFKLISSAEDALSSRIAEAFGRFDDIQDLSMIIAPGIPLNWLRLLEYLRSEKIIEYPRFHPVQFSHDRPKLFGLSLYPSTESGEKNTDGQDVLYGGHSAATTLEETLSKVVGEMLERYFLTLYRTDSLYKASTVDLKKRRLKYLEIKDLNSFLPWQKELFAEFKSDETAPINWVKGTELLSNEPAYIPAQIVFWNYQHVRNSAEPILADQTTSGAAGHFTREEATLSALLELIERDGFLIYWLNNLSPKVLDLTAHLDPRIQEFLTYVRRYRLEIFFLNTTSDIGMPTLTCVIIDKYDKEPLAVVASASGFNLEDIVLHCGREALMVYSFTTKQEAFRIPENYKPFRDIKIAHLERVRAWRGKEMMDRLRFFISGPIQDIKAFDEKHRDIITYTDRLDYILKRLKEMGKGYEVYIYEVKHYMLEKLGYHVVRANVPQLIPLYLTESMATLDSKRLREVPEKLGFQTAKELNPWPHPFP